MERGTRPSRPIAERLWRRVEKGEEHECWLWTGSGNPKGYGLIFGGPDDARMRPVHRVAYEIEIGPIPEGMEIDHLCRTRNCVNPAHLEPVDHAENCRRARRSHCKYGHEMTDENVYAYARSRMCKECAKRRAREAKQRARAAA